ncbi:site-specific tyrosine recombinase XerD [Bartonella sp. DGB1]|uniref:site-specific tyrosine recombinase XerD n=1 Tax=Bartonella sp. DGB1 TaxID=3239807 RepID=UPI0035251893
MLNLQVIECKIEEFLEMMAAERGVTTNTILAYRSDLIKYCSILTSKGIDPLNATEKDIESFFSIINQQQFSITSQLRLLSVLKQFFMFLLLENKAKENPLRHISAPKKPLIVPKFLSQKQINSLIDFAYQETKKYEYPEKKGYKKMQFYCLVELLYATGMRVSELVSLPITAVNFYDSIILIYGKGGRERYVPLNDKAIDTLKIWLKWRSLSKKAKSKFLFPANGVDGHLCRQVFARELKKAAIKVNINPELVSPHLFRHAFASHLLQNGADLRFIQQLLGHADIATTQIYTYILEDKIQKLIETYHPLATSNK